MARIQSVQSVLSAAGLLRIGLVDLRRQNKVALCQAVDLVRPDFDPGLAPRQVNVRMMSLLFCNDSDSVDEIERRLEIRKLELLLDVMIVHNIPMVHLRCQRLDFRCGERRHTSSARNARFLRQSHG